MQVTGEIALAAASGAVPGARGLFVTVSPDQAREQQACGARVIIAAGEQVRGAGADRGGAGRAAADRGRDVRPSCGRSSPGMPPPSGWPAWLSWPGCPAELVTGRQIAVLARVVDAAGAAALAAGLRRQRMAPAEVVVAVAARPGEVRRGVRPRGDRGARRPGRAGHARSTAIPDAAGRTWPAPGGPRGWRRPPRWRARRGSRRGRPDRELRPVLPARPGLRAGVRAGRRGRLRRGPASRT